MKPSTSAKKHEVISLVSDDEEQCNSTTRQQLSSSSHSSSLKHEKTQTTNHSHHSTTVRPTAAVKQPQVVVISKQPPKRKLLSKSPKQFQNPIRNPLDGFERFNDVRVGSSATSTNLKQDQSSNAPVPISSFERNFHNKTTPNDHIHQSRFSPKSKHPHSSTSNLTNPTKRQKIHHQPNLSTTNHLNSPKYPTKIQLKPKSVSLVIPIRRYLSSSHQSPTDQKNTTAISHPHKAPTQTLPMDHKLSDNNKSRNTSIQEQLPKNLQPAPLSTGLSNSPFISFAHPKPLANTKPPSRLPHNRQLLDPKKPSSQKKTTPNQSIHFVPRLAKRTYDLNSKKPTESSKTRIEKSRYLPPMYSDWSDEEDYMIIKLVTRTRKAKPNWERGCLILKRKGFQLRSVGALRDRAEYLCEKKNLKVQFKFEPPMVFRHQNWSAREDKDLIRCIAYRLYGNAPKGSLKDEKRVGLATVYEWFTDLGYKRSYYAVVARHKTLFLKHDVSETSWDFHLRQVASENWVPAQEQRFGVEYARLQRGSDRNDERGGPSNEDQNTKLVHANSNDPTPNMPAPTEPNTSDMARGDASSSANTKGSENTGNARSSSTALTNGAKQTKDTDTTLAEEVQPSDRNETPQVQLRVQKKRVLLAPSSRQSTMKVGERNTEHVQPAAVPKGNGPVATKTVSPIVSDEALSTHTPDNSNEKRKHFFETNSHPGAKYFNTDMNKEMKSTQEVGARGATSGHDQVASDSSAGTQAHQVGKIVGSGQIMKDGEAANGVASSPATATEGAIASSLSAEQLQLKSGGQRGIVPWAGNNGTDNGNENAKEKAFSKEAGCSKRTAGTKMLDTSAPKRKEVHATTGEQVRKRDMSGVVSNNHSILSSFSPSSGSRASKGQGYKRKANVKKPSNTGIGQGKKGVESVGEGKDMDGAIVTDCSAEGGGASNDQGKSEAVVPDVSVKDLSLESIMELVGWSRWTKEEDERLMTVLGAREVLGMSWKMVCVAHARCRYYRSPSNLCQRRLKLERSAAEKNWNWDELLAQGYARWIEGGEEIPKAQVMKNEEVRTSAKSSMKDEEVRTSAKSSMKNEEVRTSAKSSMKDEEVRTSAKSSMKDEEVRTSAESSMKDEEVRTSAESSMKDEEVRTSAESSVRKSAKKRRFEDDIEHEELQDEEEKQDEEWIGSESDCGDGLEDQEILEAQEKQEEDEAQEAEETNEAKDVIQTRVGRPSSWSKEEMDTLMTACRSLGIASKKDEQWQGVVAAMARAGFNRTIGACYMRWIRCRGRVGKKVKRLSFYDDDFPELEKTTYDLGVEPDHEMISNRSIIQVDKSFQIFKKIL